VRCWVNGERPTARIRSDISFGGIRDRGVMRDLLACCAAACVYSAGHYTEPAVNAE